MSLAKLINLASDSGASENQINYIIKRYETSTSDQETRNLIDEVKEKYGANKGTAQTVKTTTSAAKAAAEADVKIEEVAPAKGDIVTEADVKKAAASK